ncbi:hypothetical protein E8E11_001492 [Didymella keratinophila]|nr:hypothetical protein E8E11_001492 [Didymella keratinophila]
MTNAKASIAINASAFLCSAALVGISIAAIYLASDAYDVFTDRFSPGSYGWEPSHWWNEPENGWNIFIHYNRSSEIKTYFAAAFALAVGLLGCFAFGLSFKRPAAPLLRLSLLGSAVFAFVVALVCVVWSAVAEVNIKKTTCSFEPKAFEGHHYTCSIENAACNTLRFTDEAWPPNDFARGDENQVILNKACLQFRYARYMVIPLAAISLLLAGVYGAHVWLARGKKGEDDNAEARVRALQQD